VAVPDQAGARRDKAHRDGPAASGLPSSPALARVRAFAKRLTAGGTSGNERLTAASAVVLLVLLAALGVTILAIRPLLSVHMFVGMLLIPPVLLKMASTGYRFIRYYTSDPRYRERGAPPTILRLIAPVVVISTVVVFASGVALLLAGSGPHGLLLPLHKASFILWLAFMAVHVLGHVPDLLQALSSGNEIQSELRGYGSGRSGRILSISGALVVGLALAVLYLPQFPSWVPGPG
jgi:hypothetical protein